MGINHITLVGRLEKGPEMRYTPNGVPLTQMRLAVTRPPREGSTGNADLTDYFNIVAWRKLAEQAAENLKKGDLISVEGRMLTRTNETPDGQRRKVVEIEAQALEAIQAGSHRSAPTEQEAVPPTDAFADGPDVMFAESDEIPF